MKYIAVIQNIFTGETYEIEFDGDFEKLQSQIGKDEIIINVK